MEGPLCLPCCSHSAAGVRSPAVECKLLFASDSRRSSLSTKVRSLSPYTKPGNFFSVSILSIVLSYSSSQCSISGRFQFGFWTVRHHHTRKAIIKRAAGNPGSSQRPVAPLQLETPTGQLLSELMRSHPYLLPATIDQQLERLQSDRDAQKEEEASRDPQDLLYRYFFLLFILLFYFNCDMFLNFSFGDVSLLVGTGLLHYNALLVNCS